MSCVPPLTVLLISHREAPPNLYCSGPVRGVPDATEFDFITGSCEPFTCHSAMVADQQLEMTW
jgi:hypothetical protein